MGTQDFDWDLAAELETERTKWLDQEPIVCPENKIVTTKKGCRDCNGCGKWDK